MRRYQTLTATADGSLLREEMLEGRPHLVVPIVGLIGDSVIQGANASTPELIPASVLSAHPELWNGRPCVPYHPQNSSGQYISANSADVLTLAKFGTILNSTYSDGKLKMEGWLDRGRANELGAEPQSTIEKLDNGEMVEISTGCFVEVEARSGEIHGQTYSGVWTDIDPDHLAVGIHKGACSIADGCGGPRVNKGVDMSGEEKKDSPTVPESRGQSQVVAREIKVGPLKRLLSGMRGQARTVFEDGPTYSDLMGELAEALRAVEPGLDWVINTNLAHSAVVYLTHIMYNYADYNSEYKWWRRTYSATIDANSVSITLNDDAVEIEPIERYISVSEDDGSMSVNTPGAVRVNCQCQEERVMTKEARASTINKVIACSRNPYSEGDRKGLEALSDETLEKLGADPVEEKPVAATVPAAVPETPAPAAQAAPVAPPAFTLESLPADVRTVVNRGLAREAAYKKSIVTKLLSAQSEYDEARLNSHSVEDLESMARMLKVDEPAIDYSPVAALSRPNVAPTKYTGGWSAALNDKAN